jgi:hypothetical protein
MMKMQLKRLEVWSVVHLVVELKRAFGQLPLAAEL